MLASYVLASALALFLARPVVGHGFTTTITVGGTPYPGWNPNTDPYTVPAVERIVRRIPNDGPIKDVSSSDLACNIGGSAPQKTSAKVAAGGKIEFQWTTWPADHAGPVSTYMASCGGACKNLDLSKTKVQWFKIDAAGYDSARKRWATDDLIAAGSKWTSTVPASLAAGEYLVRHEIIALHQLPAQMYPLCAQVQVTGSGTAKPSGSELVSIPGLYDNTRWPDIWADGFKSFATPGPAAFGSSGSSPAPPAQASSSTLAAPSTKAPVSTSSKSAATPTSSSSAATVPTTKAAVAVSSTTAAPSASATTRRCRRRSSTAVFAKPTGVAANVRRSHGFVRRSRH